MRRAVYGPVIATEEDLRQIAGAHGHSLGLWPQQPWRPTVYVEGRWPVARLARSLSTPAVPRPGLRVPPLAILFVVLEASRYGEAEAAELQRHLRHYHPGLLVELGDVLGASAAPAPPTRFFI